MSFRVFVYSIILFFVGHHSYAKEEIINFDITKELRYYIDNTNQLNARDIYSQIIKKTHETKNSFLKKGYVYQNQWIYFKVRNPSSIKKHLNIVYDSPYSGAITPYIRVNDSWVEQNKIGSSIKFKKSQRRTLRPTLRSSFNIGEEKEYLYKINSHHRLKLKLKIQDDQFLFETQTRKISIIFCYLGLSIFAILVGVSFLLLNFIPSVLTLISFIFFFSLVVIIKSGVIEFIDIGLPFPLKHYSPFPSVGLSFSIIIFQLFFLNVKKLSLFLYRAQFFIIMSNILFSISLCLPFDKVLGLQRGYHLYLILIPSVASVMIISVFGMIKKNIPAYYFSAAFFISCIPFFEWPLSNHTSVLSNNHDFLYLCSSFLSFSILLTAIFQEYLYKERQYILNSIIASSKARYVQALHEMIYNISTPLMKIKTYSFKLEKVANDSIFPYTQKIIQSEESMSTILHNARSINSKPEFTFYNIKNTLFKSLDLLDSSRKKKNITFNLSLDETLEFYVDESKCVYSLFNNILTNSIKFSDRNSQIDILLYKEKDFSYLVFRDYGRGIPKNIQNTLFNKNNQNTRLGTQGEAGTGFGMGIIKETVTLFDADVKVKSPLGPEQSGTQVILKFKVLGDKC